MRKIDQHKIKSNEKKQIKLSPYIDSLNSSFTYVSLNNNFELKVRQNRKMVSNGENVKTAIESIDDKLIWVRDTSLFKFQKFNELNQIGSDIENLRTLYKIPTKYE